MVAKLIARVGLLILTVTAIASRADAAGVGRDGCIRLPCGTNLAYREFGDPRGPLVFYFHGTPGSRAEAGLIADDVRRAGLRLVAIDRPGLGGSGSFGGRRILDWPRDVATLADALGATATPFGIIGMSGGAPYAAACAVAMPERISHVAIVSGHTPPGVPGVCAGSQDELMALVTRRPRLARLGFGFVSRRLNRRPDKVVKMITKNWTAADRQLVLCDPDNYQQLIANLDEAARCIPGMITDIRLLATPWGFCLNEIRGVPVSIWQGGCDRISTPSMGHYFNEQIAGSELTIDPRAGHVTMLKWHAPEILARFQ